MAIVKDEEKNGTSNWRTVLEPGKIATLRELEAEGSPGLVADLAGMFLREAPKRLEKIAASVAEKDWERVRRESHLLCGGVGNFGASAAMACAAELEAYASEPGMESERAIGAYARLEKECRLVCEALASLQDELNRAS
jgi:HPt (histidine-containing phosphotransfer) domain-containing protein